MTTEERIMLALAERKAMLDECPALKRSLGDEPCPHCHATTAGPCWLNVRADAAFVDAMKEIVA
jgi:tRNA G26 N,N-dimethylase Trm1